MKKMIMILLVLIMAISFCACTSTETNETAKETLSPESVIWGTWEGELLGFKMVYDFNEDGTFSSYGQSNSAYASVSGTNGTYVYDTSANTLTLYNDDGTTKSMPIEVLGSRLIIKASSPQLSMDIIYTKVD